MLEPLTNRQQTVLEYLVAVDRQHGYPPSIREIGHALKLRSLRGVTDHLDALEAKGYIVRDREARGIRIRFTATGQPVGEEGIAVPILGRIAAGRPLLAEEHQEGTLTVDERFVRHGQHFALTLRGDSMLDAGLLDGDHVIVRQQPTADSGQIVAVLIGQEATVKRLRLDGPKTLLVPANSRYQAIDVADCREPVTILGRVVAVVRELRD